MIFTLCTHNGDYENLNKSFILKGGKKKKIKHFFFPDF